jgi:DoxX-like family
MLHVLSIWLLVVAFFGAGVFNAIGTPATKNSFVRWGYPQWWCRVTGGLEMVAAVLIALPGRRDAGLILGAVIAAATVLTVLRHREFSHIVPLSVFVALIALAETPNSVVTVYRFAPWFVPGFRASSQ